PPLFIAMDADTYSALVTYCATSTYPLNTTKNKKRIIRRQAVHFIAHEGLLYYADAEHGRRHVVREDEKHRVIEEAHCSRLGGAHFARDRTYDKIAERFYWVGIKDDVADFVSRCDHCQRNSARFNQVVQPLRPMPITDRVWHMIGIDLVTNL